MKPPRAYASNRLASHLAYPKILSEYNARLARDGKVNAKKFYEEIVSKEIRDYSMSAWYQFLKRFETPQGLSVMGVKPREGSLTTSEGAPVEDETKIIIVDNQRATADMIQRVLNISAHAAQAVLDDPDLIPYEKRIELGLKVMKAQDSRVKAIGGMRADMRDQERFERAQDSAAYA